MAGYKYGNQVGGGGADAVARAGVGELTAQLAETAIGLSFAKAKNVETILYTSDSPRILDSMDDGYLYGNISSTLYRKKNIEDAWQMVTRINSGDAITGIRLLGDGEVLVACAVQGIWKSSGWGQNPSTANFTRVLNTDGMVKQYSFSVDRTSGWIFVTTYINGDMTNSRYAWLSKNNGKTFEVVFDMLSYDPDHDKSHSHMHVALIDSYHNPVTPRLWLSYHKTNDDPTEATNPMKRIKYSDDSGKTWVAFSNEKYQPVCAVSLPNGVVFGDDINEMGLYFVKRQADPSKMEYQWIYAIRGSLAGIFGWGTKAIVDENGNAHIAFRSSVAGQPARIISTDGENTAETVLINPINSNDAVDLVDIVAFKGKLLGTYHQTGSGMSYMLKADIPTRGTNLDGYETIGGTLGGVGGPGGVANGYGSTSGNRGTSTGFTARSGRDSVSMGFNSQSEIEAVSVGKDSKALLNGVSVGYNAQTDQGVSVGRNTVSDRDSLSNGVSAKATSEGVALGSFSESLGAQSVAIGRTTKATGTNSVAVGGLAQATATGAVAFGRNAKATHDHSVVMGWGGTSTAGNQFKVGARHIELNNITNPSTFPIAGARLFTRLNGNGKTELCVLFPSGSPIVISTEL